MALSPLLFQTRKRRPSVGSFITPSNLSQTALVQALMLLAQELSLYKPLKPLQKRNSSAIIRKVKLLTVLFETLKETQSPLPKTAILCFREIFIVLERIKALLDDCNNGSRIWLLMQNEEVSNQFYELTLELATLLDVLPLKELTLLEDVKEQVELVHKQCGKSKLFIDQSDKTLRSEVLSILDEIGREIIPERSKLKQIFDRLEITDGQSCRREMAFLEEEVQAQGLTDKSTAVINSLVSLVRYCKCVLFGISSPEPENFRQEKPLENEEGTLIPDDFRCPISLDLMHDPVIVASGQTYERSSISRWIEDGHLTCPKSGQVLAHTNLVPNHALRSLIAQWCRERGVPFEKSEKGGRNEAATCTKAALEATKMTASFLVSQLSVPEVASQAVYELRLLAKSGSDNRACIAEAGAIEKLVPLMRSTDVLTQENAVTAILNLSILEDNKGRIMATEGCLAGVVHVLSSGLTAEARENAAAALFSLSATPEHKRAVAEEPGALAALVRLLSSGGSRGRRDAVSALFNLAVHRENHEKVLKAGVVNAIMKMFSEEGPLLEEGLVEDSLAVVALLIRRCGKQGAMAFVKGSSYCSSSLIGVLVGILGWGSARSREQAVATLLDVCRGGGGEAVREVAGASGAGRMLYELMAAGTPRARRKAASLGRLCHRWEVGRVAAATESVSVVGASGGRVSIVVPTVAHPLER
ncbi:hypothetical protein AMTRI_Chr08g209180 [Amborella trichopoda]